MLELTDHFDMQAKKGLNQVSLWFSLRLQDVRIFMNPSDSGLMGSNMEALC